jgi:hypothetical protein
VLESLGLWGAVLLINFEGGDNFPGRMTYPVIIDSEHLMRERAA